MPPLHLAAREGQVDCCVLLLQRNAPAEGRDAHGRTPLMLALEHGHSECANTLIPHCTNLDATCHLKQPSLHRAAMRGLTAPVALMLTRGVDVCATDGRGRTALHVACASGEPSVAMQIVSSGPNGRRCLDMIDAVGSTPALCAARLAYLTPKRRTAQLHCVATCILLGADCSAEAAAVTTAAAAAYAQSASASEEAVGVALMGTPPHGKDREPTEVSRHSSGGETGGSAVAAAAAAGGAGGLLPLHFYLAALDATDLLLQVVERLVRCPTSPAGTQAGRAPAATVPSPKETAPPRLLRARPLDAKSCGGFTVLHFAAAHGAVGSVRLLLAHGAVSDIPDANGELASDYALRGVPGVCLPGAGHAECHQMLMRHLAR